MHAPGLTLPCKVSSAPPLHTEAGCGKAEHPRRKFARDGAALALVLCWQCAGCPAVRGRAGEGGGGGARCQRGATH